MYELKKIFDLFLEKQPRNETYLLPSEGGKFITHLNPYSFFPASNFPELYSKATYIASDGIFPVLVTRLFKRYKIKRFSFDMGSYAKNVFAEAERRELGIFIVGSTDKNLKIFSELLKTEYPDIVINGFHDGYFSLNNDNVLNCIVKLKPKVIVIGMGTPLQDHLAVLLRGRLPKANIYTCGAFIEQSTRSIQYYPNWVNMLHLRFLYRIFKEKHVLKRVIKTYPKFAYQYSKYLATLNK